MGPAAFMWPPDRVWSGQMDNIAPCGSVDSVGTRTLFPLKDGKVALTAQDDSYNAVLRVAFSNNPTTQADFKTILNTVPVNEIDPGHTCLSIPNPPSNIAAGTNATIQIKYTADFDSPQNQTFYACADITYAPAETFNFAQIPCFNATQDEDVPAPTATGVVPTNLPGHGDNEPPLVTPGATATPGPSTGGGGVTLSSGAIAGAVVGSVAGFILLLLLGFLLYREKQQKKRLERQRNSAMGVPPWREDPAKDSVSAGSVRLQNLR
ncbi:hypothetical protein B0H63DRAFT_221023 [Podospora didyma]|uniref:Copper acquisition factor BIM1-like domain-containing protein n=1 Tax=Podospora didyma TaxID=330526 RepID=A0AAE0NCH7_9PEZI|nr:hypothetical protein B0H63DRAFT_221023 [Podospora didyma]